MAAATAVVIDRNNDTFRGIFNETWQVVATLDAGSLVDGAGETETVAVPGVALGDIVLGCSFAVDEVGMSVTAYVSAANVISIRVQNESGSTVDLASCKIRLVAARMV
jgi:hypothetical protein